MEVRKVAGSLFYYPLHLEWGSCIPAECGAATREWVPLGPSDSSPTAGRSSAQTEVCDWTWMMSMFFSKNVQVHREQSWARRSTVFLQSRWWSLRSSWPDQPADWCIGPRSGIVVPAVLAPPTDSLRLPPGSHIPSPSGPAGIPLCPGTNSQLLDCWHSALHRKLLATGSSQGPDKHKIQTWRYSCRAGAPVLLMSYQLPLWSWGDTKPVGLCAIN